MQYLYMEFVAEQIIGIIGPKIKVKRVFNIASTLQVP